MNKKQFYDLVEEINLTKSAQMLKLREKIKNQKWFFDMSKNIPTHWFQVNFMDITWLITCGVAKKPEYINIGIPFLSAQNTRPFKTNLNKIKYISKEAYNKLTVGGKPEKEDILYTRVGNCGEAAKIPYEFDFAIYVSLTLIKPIHELVFSDYLVAFLNSIYGKNQANAGAIGIGLKNLNVANVRKYKIPIPPLPEQRAIVAKIEALFSDLDNGIASLKKAEDQLKIYRQAVLKKAFEGELTKEWREKQTDLPSAEVLLEQIKEERQRYYEQQLADWKLAVLAWEASGKVGKKPIKIKKKAILSSFQEVYNLPNMWKFGVLQNIVLEGPANGYSPKANNDKSGTKSLKLTATTSRKFIINESSIKYLGFDIPKDSKYWLKDNDILIQRANTIEYVGATAIFKKKYGDFIYPDLMMRIRLGKNLIAEYIAYFLNSNLCQSYFRKNATGTTGSMPKINGRVVGSTQIPLCSLKEQHQIVQEIESRLSVCDQVEKSIQESLDKAVSLRQSILKKAFEGKLLTAAELEACRQEKDWEPASVLLERIKEEKAQAELLAKEGKRKTRTN